MIRNYYYTVCSLPPLSFQSVPPPLTRNEFLKLCEVEVSRRNVDLLGRLSLVPAAEVQGRNRVLDRWFGFEGSLRNTLARIRAKRIHRAGKDDARPEFPLDFPAAEAGKIVASETPLEAEEEMDLARWRRLDDLDNPSDFSLGRLIVYALKLQVLERRGRFDADRGEAILKEATPAPPRLSEGEAPGSRP